jgi:hypothetical protein
LQEDVLFAGGDIKVIYYNIIKCSKPFQVRSKFKLVPFVCGPQKYQGTEFILENLTMYLCGQLVFLVDFGVLLFCVWQPVKQKPKDIACRRNCFL